MGINEASKSYHPILRRSGRLALSPEENPPPKVIDWLPFLDMAPALEASTATRHQPHAKTTEMLPEVSKVSPVQVKGHRVTDELLVYWLPSWKILLRAKFHCNRFNLMEP